MSLKGKVIVIVGGTGTVGSGIAKVAVEQGALIAVPSRSGSFQQLKQDIKGKEQQLFTFKGDTSTIEGATKFKDAVLNKYNKIDHVVTSIGSWKTAGPLSLRSKQELLDAFKTYCLSHWVVAKVFLPVVKDQEGSSYTIISGAAGSHVLDINASLVTLGAASLFGLSLGLRKEFEKAKLRLNELRIGMFIKRTEHLKDHKLPFPVFDHVKIGELVVNIFNAKKTKSSVINVNQPQHFTQNIE